jgi:hypothetical protein
VTVVDSAPDAADDGRGDDLAALDFGVGEPAEAETDLGVILGGYGGTGTSDDAAEHTADLLDGPAGEVAGYDEAPTFTVTNPPGTVTVTTYLDGRVAQVELSPRAAAMGERGLAEEIVVIAGLATQDARSAQYSLMVDGMREQGHDDVATRDFLSRDLDLPTPEQARAARAALFTNRYAGDHD